MADSVAAGQLNFESAEPGEAPSNGLSQVLVDGRRSQCGAQNLPRLFLHGTPVMGSTDPQPGFGLLVELTNNQSSRAPNASMRKFVCDRSEVS